MVKEIKWLRRHNLDMNRLLLAPLLIALTGCSNQIGITNNVGEKAVSKDQRNNC